MAAQQINGSVGQGGMNAPMDVEKAQTLLKNKKFYDGTVSKVCDLQTIAAIKKFQAQFMKTPDGRIDPHGGTWKRLTGVLPMGPALSQSDTDKTTLTLSGAKWVSQYPTSRSIADLSNDFRPKVVSFLAALDAAKASYSVAATLRPRERAMLMHLAWDIVHGTLTPEKANTHCKEGLKVHDKLIKIPINWVHDTEAASKQAARDMVRGYQLRYRPSLTSNHIIGDAIDFSVSWNKDLTIVDGTTKKEVVIKTIPRSGGNAELHKIGKSYGVHKLVKDPPHWSKTGK